MMLRRLPITARLAACTLLATFLYLALAMHDAQAQSRSYPVDDSASQVLERLVPMEWDSTPGSGAASHAVSGTVTVLVRLDVAPWRGRPGRIYMSLPHQPSGPVTATWTTRGPLLPGVLRAGERQLVYAGPIDTALIEDTMRLHLQADGRRLGRNEQLDFSFEIEPGAL
ncbi:hypothetical protein [Marilutibacter alkalisoli]|uniref:Uncharacterized protein n=1 Tax=Marilutibacter alkalisoli TaxID=2591633 RepID=A0A514BVU7_9GAMM|nr:hypothetical protein [Lysobacter alkalisoli]QDH71528.1 hypothetical protein FKV23_16585 [Lysobacter alkalisoli]